MNFTKRFFKYLIDRAVDRGWPLRGLTAWFVHRDAELRHYEKRMRAVDIRLRNDLDDHLGRPLLDRGCEETPVSASRPETRLAGHVYDSFDQSSSGHMRRRWIHLGLAVIIVTAIAIPVTILLLSNSESNTIVENGHSPVIIDEHPPENVPEIMVVENLPQQSDQSSSPASWDIVRANLQREGQFVFDRIPRPSKFIPRPDSDAICDSLSASNPVCEYLIASYVRPVFSSDSPADRKTEL